MKLDSKIMKLALGLMITMSAALTSAQSVKQDILSLTREIQDSVIDTPASPQDLLNVRNSLARSLMILQNGSIPSPGISKECLDFAYEKYFVSMSSSAAMDKSKVICRNVEAISEMKYLYEKFFVSQSSSAAMDNAGNMATSRLKGKLSLLDFAYNKYFISQSSSAAATNAVRVATTLPLGSLGCLQQAYDRYFQSMSSPAAMDKSISFCSP